MAITPTDKDWEIYDRYKQSNDLMFTAEKMNLEPRDALDAISLCMKYIRDKKSKGTFSNKKCDKCIWKSGNRPCVMPIGICGITLKKKEN